VKYVITNKSKNATFARPYTNSVKKISTYSINPLTTNYTSDAVTPGAYYWRITWSSGTTESGSSGAPLINNDRRIIGQLRGAYTKCIDSAIWGPDKGVWCGKFEDSWTGVGWSGKERKLDYWLDPLGTNPATINGLCKLPVIGSSINGPSTVNNSEINTFVTTQVT